MRLATFNILHGRSTSDGVVDVERLAQAVRTLDPDVLALQEVDRDQPRSHLADLTHVAADAMGAVSHRFAAALAGTPGATWQAATGSEAPGTATYGIALLSRFPARNWQVLRLPRLRGTPPVWLPDAHKLVRVHEEPRSAVVGILDTPHGVLTVASTHLSFVPGWNFFQLRQLRRNLEAFTGPLVVMGDLNMGPRPASAITGYHALAAAPTFPNTSPLRQLDHILLRTARPTSTARGETPAVNVSDHRPLAADVDATSLGLG